MQTVYKYPFPINDAVTMGLPAGAEILHVDRGQVSPFELTLWALVDTDAEQEPVTLFVRGTGHPMTGQEGRHLATVIAGPLVWHVFGESEWTRAEQELAQAIVDA